MVSSAPLAGTILRSWNPSGPAGPGNGSVVTIPPPAAPATPHPDKITYLLLAATVFFALILIGVDKLFPDEGQVFQVLANLTSGFAGAFFTRIQPVGAHSPGAPASVVPISNGGAPSPQLPPVPDQAADVPAAATAAAPPSTK